MEISEAEELWASNFVNDNLVEIDILFVESELSGFDIKTFVETVLAKDESIQQATSANIDDIYINENISEKHPQHVFCNISLSLV